MRTAIKIAVLKGDVVRTEAEIHRIASLERWYKRPAQIRIYYEIAFLQALRYINLL